MPRTSDRSSVSAATDEAGLGQDGLGRLRVGVDEMFGGPHRHAERDQPGLRSV